MPVSREIITAEGAPAAVGPYAHAVRTGDLLFISGQVPLDPATNELVAGEIGDRTRRCLDNLEAICAAAGGALADAVRCTIYVTDMGRFADVNEAYGEWFGSGHPARVTVAVVALPLGADVEIEAVVALAA